jgi:hypothetical protein
MHGQSLLNLSKCWVSGLVFGHDNASIHTAKAVQEWFKDHAIPISNWPPYSPDLNLIENGWFCLKNKIVELHPELKVGITTYPFAGGASIQPETKRWPWEEITSGFPWRT